MKPVLLIFPGRKRKKPHIPLSVIALAAYLRKHRIKAELLDTRISDYKDVPFEKYLAIGFSVPGGEGAKTAYDITKYIKQNFSDTLVIWGGPLASACASAVCNSGLVDFVVRREGEETLLELIRCANKNKPFDSVKGVTFRKKGIVISNPDRPFLDMNKLPVPAYDLLDMSKYSLGNPQTIEMETSRGCPSNCTYCYSAGFHKRQWRGKSVKNLVRDIKLLMEKYHVHSFIFWDDNFFADKKRVLLFCQTLKRLNLKIIWEVYSRADNIAQFSDDEMALLKWTGLKFLMIGAESGSQHVLDSLGKNLKVDDIIVAISKCAKQGINTVISFMIGPPGETFEDIKKTINLCEQIKKTYPKAHIRRYKLIHFHPGSTLYKKHILCKPFETLEDVVSYNPINALTYKWLSRSQLNNLKTIMNITTFFSLQQLFRIRGKAFKKNLLDSAQKKILWNFLFPFVYLDALIRWKTYFFCFGYEWSFFWYVANRSFANEMNQL